MSLKYDIPVSFAFLTAPSTHVCVPSSVSHEAGHSPALGPPHGSQFGGPVASTVSASRTGIDNDGESREEKWVTVKWLDHAHLSAQTRVLPCTSHQTMGTLYEQIERGGRFGENVVCFVSTPTPFDNIRLGVPRTLQPHDPVPAVVFCQNLTVPYFLAPSTHCACVHILVFTASGNLRAAQPPCLVPTTTFPSIDTFLAVLALQLGSTPAELDYLKRCTLVSCTCEEDTTVIISHELDNEHVLDAQPHHDTLPQFALLLPLLAPGDVVRVDVRAVSTAAVVVQGIISRTTIDDSGVRYDVLEPESSLELPAQVCTRVVPI